MNRTLARQQGRNEQAIELYKRSLRLRPGIIQAWEGWGKALAAQGKYNEAVDVYRLAVGRASRATADAYRVVLGLAPESGLGGGGGDGDVELRFALLLSQVGRYDESVQVFEAAVRMVSRTGLLHELCFEPRSFAPNSPSKRRFDAAAHAGIGSRHLVHGYPDAAIAEQQEAIRIAPDFAPAHLYLGYALRFKGQTTEARAAWQNAVRFGTGEVAAKAREELERVSVRWIRQPVLNE